MTSTDEAMSTLERWTRKCTAIYEMLEQDEVWVDAQGRVHQIESMSVSYKSNVLAFLRRRIEMLTTCYPWGAIGQTELMSGWRPTNGTLPDGSEAWAGPQLTRGEFMGLGDFGNMDAAFDDWLTNTDQQIEKDPERWLDDRPLMRRLSDDVLNGIGGSTD